MCISHFYLPYDFIACAIPFIQWMEYNINIKGYIIPLHVNRCMYNVYIFMFEEKQAEFVLCFSEFVVVFVEVSTHATLTRKWCDTHEASCQSSLIRT